MSDKVLASTKALQWDFPGYAVSISFKTFSDLSFQNELVSFLEQASTESVKQFGNYTVKGGVNTFEPREVSLMYLLSIFLSAMDVTRAIT